MEVFSLSLNTENEAIQKAIDVLSGGGLLIYPTETCYGLGVDALNPIAVEKLLRYKTRREGKPFSVAVADMKMASQYVEINETAKNLYDTFLPGPLTVVSKSRGRVSPLVESEEKTLGIRIPAYDFVRALVKEFGKPITATSANVSYAKKPYSLAEWKRYTPKKNQALVSLFLDGGTLPISPASTVVDTTLDDYEILRQGEITIAKAVKPAIITNSETETRQLAKKILVKYRESYPNTCLIFSLKGDLGAGKTQFAKGIADGLGIRQNVLSPTYILMREYPFKNGKFIHVDTWRIFSESELDDLNIRDYIKPGNVIAIEWAEKAVRLLDEVSSDLKVKIITVMFTHQSPRTREISVSD